MCQIPKDAIKMQALLSFDTQKRNNIHHLGNSKVLTAAGTHVIILDLTTSLLEYIPTPVQGGIGALAASSDGRYAAAFCLPVPDKLQHVTCTSAHAHSLDLLCTEVDTSQLILRCMMLKLHQEAICSAGSMYWCN